jgi:hypothetical protein
MTTRWYELFRSSFLDGSPHYRLVGNSLILATSYLAASAARIEGAEEG